MLCVGRQHASIDPVVLGQHANASREVADLARIDDRCLVPGFHQLRGQTPLEPAGGFQDDNAVVLGKLREQLLDSLAVVRTRQASSFGQDHDVELTLGDIDTYKRDVRVVSGTVHGVVPILLMRARGSV